MLPLALLTHFVGTNQEALHCAKKDEEADRE